MAQQPPQYPPNNQPNRQPQYPQQQPPQYPNPNNQQPPQYQQQPQYQQPQYQQPQYGQPQYGQQPQRQQPPRRGGFRWWYIPLVIVGGIFLLGLITSLLNPNGLPANQTATAIANNPLVEPATTRAATPTKATSGDTTPTPKLATNTPRPTRDPDEVPKAQTAGAQTLEAMAANRPPTQAPAQAEPTKPPASVATAKPAATPVPATNPSRGKIGQTLTSKDGSYSIVVAGVERAEKYIEFAPAKPGNVYLAVDLTVQSNKDGVNANAFYASLKDSNGFKYNIAFAGKDPAFSSQNGMPKGDRLRGWLTYEVPASANGFVLDYQPVDFSGGSLLSVELQ